MKLRSYFVESTKLNALLSNGKDKLDLFLSEYKRNFEIERRMNAFNKGETGACLAYIVIFLACCYVFYRLFLS